MPVRTSECSGAFVYCIKCEKLEAAVIIAKERRYCAAKAMARPVKRVSNSPEINEWFFVH